MGCCDSTTNTIVGCCSIHGTVPSGAAGVRWDSTGVTGQATGAKVHAYTADGSGTTPLTLGPNQRFWVAHLQLIVQTAGVALVYRGTAAGDYTAVNRILIGGPVSDNGGIVATLPNVRLQTGQELWVKLDNSDAYQVTGYGILETVSS